MNKKIISLVIVIVFLTIPLNQCFANQVALGDASSLCYGFILPNSRFDNKTIENQHFCRTRHLVNDLLREAVPVYWTTSNITVNISEVTNEDEFNLLFEKGSFVVPFTGDNTIDSKIIVIICDYNQSSEIEKSNNISTPVYLLKEQLKISVHILSEVKIANFINFLTCGESWFSDIASKCGFLNFDFIKNDDTHKNLNNSAYNLLIWPGYDCYYPSSLSFLEIILDLRTGRNRAIRKFVSNGGGFVGSCYSVYMASRGTRPLPIYPSRKVHIPNLPSIGLLSISDIISAKGKNIDSGLEQQIMDTNHPVSFGVDSYLIGGKGTGPMIVDVGKGVDIIANFKNDDKLNDTPSIVSNKFGDGKVVLFAPHSEIRDPDTGPKFWDRGTAGTYNGKKLISNAFYYSTCPERTEQELSESRPLSFIIDIWNETKDLTSLLNVQVNVFEDVKAGINDSIENVTNLIDNVYSILESIIQIGIDLNIDSNEIKSNLYYGGTKYLIYCFNLVNRYLENTSATIQTIEKIFPLFEDDISFIEQLEELKNDLTSQNEEIRDILSTCSKKLQKMENLLESYKKYPILRKNMEKVFKKTSHDLEIQTEYIFQHMPGGYFNSLKFLRNYWYYYETSIAL